MKNLIVALLSIALIFTACEKEEDSTPTPTPTTTYGFSCKVGGDDFTVNSPDVILDQNNLLTIHAENGGDEITIRIYNFLDRIVGEEISLNYGAGISGAYVTKDGVDYTNTLSGKLIFTKIGTELSGTFNFISRAADFSSKSVTEGVFVDLTY